MERELSASRDIGEKVQKMRQMLQESHSGIGQLCSLVDQERQKREQCAQGLKQQRLRTELLLQLLHHFKNRTQDLAPGAMLAAVGNGTQATPRGVPGNSGIGHMSMQEPVSLPPLGGVHQPQ